MGSVAMKAALERRLAERAPQLGVRRVDSMDRLSGGLSFETYVLTVGTASGSARWILRREPSGGPLEPYDIRYEAAIFDRLSTTAVPVPAVMYVEEDPSILGRRFQICEFVAGKAHPHTAPRFNDPAVRENALESFVDMLATIHALPVDDLPKRPGGAEEHGALAEVRLWRSRLDVAELAPRPVLRYVFDVLADNAPEGNPQVLVHGDYRLSNLLWEGNVISGVLDWERSFRGDPMADVAYTLNKALGGWCAIKDRFAERYSTLTGFEVDHQRLVFWRLLELAKSAVVGMASAAALARGRSADLRLLSVANASTAIEPALLRLVDALTMSSPVEHGITR